MLDYTQLKHPMNRLLAKPKKKLQKAKYLATDPKIMGGVTVIAGTRIPISRVLFLLKDGYTIDSIVNDYPHLGRKTIEGAIREAIVSFEKPHATFSQVQASPR